MPSLKDALNAILADYEINGRRTSQRQVECYAHLSRILGGIDRDLSTVGYTQIAQYVRSRLEEGAAPSTARNEINALRRGFNLLELAGEARCPKFPTVRLNNVRKGFLEDEHLTAILRHLPQDIASFFRFLFLTGWRAGDAMGLTWSANVDFVGGIVRIDPGVTKCGEGRTFPFAVLPELRILLVDQLRETKNLEASISRVVPWVFWRLPDGHPIVNYRDSWIPATQLAGFPGALVHDMRRTAVRNLERASVPRSVAMRLTGHRTESVYSRYAITNEQDLAEGVKKLSEWRDRWRQQGKGKGDA